MTAPAYPQDAPDAALPDLKLEDAEGGAVPAPELAGAGGAAQELEGELLTEQDEAKVVRKLEYYFTVDEKRSALRLARARRAKLWRQGFRNVYLTSDDSGENPNVYAPPTNTLLSPVPNYVARLCRRVTAQLLADPPLPEVNPTSGDEQHEAHADFSTKLLRNEHSESGQNFRQRAETASSMAHTFGSAFAYCTIDPKGGGWEAMDVQAHPNATDVNAPTVDPEPPTVEQPALDPMTGQPAVDPMTGQPMPPQVVPNPKYLGPGVPLVRRYVMPDGTLSDRKAGAKRRWLPRDQWCLLPAINVRMIPHTVASGLNEAHGAILCLPSTIGELKSKFPVVARMTNEELAKLAEYRPPKHADIGRLKLDVASSETKVTEDGQITDETVCYPLTLYFRSHGAYPKGAYIVGAAGRVLHKQVWAVTLENGEEECLMLPLVQCRDFDDDEGDPMGIGLVEYLGALDEINAQVWTFLLEHLFKHGNPNIYTMAMSPVQPEEYRRRDGTPIEVATKEDVPVLEQVPEAPKIVSDMAIRIAQELNTESGLEAAAQGVATPSVSSGVHAQQVIEQALVALGQMKRNLDDYIVGVWRVALQVRRAFWTQPQRLRYESEDGAWREKEWSASDLASAKDVRIARGTGTMLSASAKQAFAREQYELGAITLEDYQRMTATNTSAVMGYQDNPHRQRVMRQITTWKDGPPEEVAGDDAATAQAAQAILAPLPVDAEPTAAKVRMLELGRLLASTAFMKHPAPWREPMAQAYEAARMAAGVQTIAEQQAAAQAAAEQQANAERQKQEQALAAKGEAEAGRQAAKESSEERRHRMALERDAIRGQGQSQRDEAKAAQQTARNMRENPLQPGADASAATPEPELMPR